MRVLHIPYPRMAGENGLELAERLKNLKPNVLVIIFSAMNRVEQEALASGVVNRFAHKGDLWNPRHVLDNMHDELRP